MSNDPVVAIVGVTGAVGADSGAEIAAERLILLEEGHCLRDQALAQEAIDLVRSKRQDDGRWLLENTHPGPAHIQYDDGEKELGVGRELIRSLEGKRRSPSPPSGGRRESTDELREGSKVEARYKGGAKWFAGKITRARSDGTYDVEYEDGDESLPVLTAKVVCGAANNQLAHPGVEKDLSDRGILYAPGTQTVDVSLTRVFPIKMFRLQARPYQWVEFRDVALKPASSAEASAARGASVTPFQRAR